MLRFAVPLLLAALLLSPTAASAQTPPPAKAAPQKVSIQVTFITVQTEDLDALGINFNLTPLPASPRTFIALVEGNIAAQLYQTLTRTAALVGTHTIALAPITVSDNVPAVFAVNTQVPMDAMPLPINQGHSDFPQLEGSIQLRGKITLIPQIVPGNVVRLDMLSPASNSQRIRFRTVPGGQQVAMNAKAFVMPLNSTNQGSIKSFSGHNKVSHTMELLIFIRPTIIKVPAVVTEASAVVTATSTFIPPTHFLGAAIGNPFAGTTFGDAAPSNTGDASSNLLGFGITKPSDIFRPMSALDFAHQQTSNSKISTTSKRSPSIQVPQPNTPKRIYAL